MNRPSRGHQSGFCCQYDVFFSYKLYLVCPLVIIVQLELISGFLSMSFGFVFSYINIHREEEPFKKVAKR